MRHLYVLAVEPRCLSMMDVETRAEVPAPLRLHLAPQQAGPATSVDVDAPCLVPGSDQVQRAWHAYGNMHWESGVTSCATVHSEVSLSCICTACFRLSGHLRP